MNNLETIIYQGLGVKRHLNKISYIFHDIEHDFFNDRCLSLLPIELDTDILFDDIKELT